MEVLVMMARKWYKKGAVPKNWKDKLMDVNPDREFMVDVLEELLEDDNRWYYTCPRCSFYV